MICIFRVQESSVGKVAHCCIDDVREDMGHGVQEWQLKASNREEKEKDNYSRTTGSKSNIAPLLSATNTRKPSQDLPLESLLVHSNVRMERCHNLLSRNHLPCLCCWDASVMIWPICQYIFARPPMSCSRA
jgi:hypothetical protein